MCICLFLCEIRSFLEDGTLDWISRTFPVLCLVLVESVIIQAPPSLRQLRLNDFVRHLPTQTMHFPSHRMPRRPSNCLHSKLQRPPPMQRTTAQISLIIVCRLYLSIYCGPVSNSSPTNRLIQWLCGLSKWRGPVTISAGDIMDWPPAPVQAPLSHRSIGGQGGIRTSTTGPRTQANRQATLRDRFIPICRESRYTL